jgi:very-short-patch-repair endonuclease
MPERLHRIQPKMNRLSRVLRENATTPEMKLWAVLRSRRLNEYKFRRQYVVGAYILDFYCVATRLAIELDGSMHAEKVVYDTERTAWLNDQGIEVIRFTNLDVTDHLDEVLTMILEAGEARKEHIKSSSVNKR